MVTEDCHSDLNDSTDYHIDKHRSYHEDDNEEEEEEETLSLCDLPIHSDSFKWDDHDFSTRDHSSKSFENDDDDDDDPFEFFSDDSTNPNHPHKTDNIIFCGKLIPYKGAAKNDDARAAPELPKQAAPVKRRRRQGGPRSGSNGNCEGFRVGARVTSVLASTRPRWYAYLFGMLRFPPAEMAAGDMRSRLSRRRSGGGSGSGSKSRNNNIMVASLGGEGKGETTRRKVSSKRGRRGGGLWGLLRALIGCRSSHVESVAKAAYGVVPRMSGA